MDTNTKDDDSSSALGGIRMAQMKTGIEIAQEHSLIDIYEIAKKAQIPSSYVEPYGKYKAKIHLDFYRQIQRNPDGNLILVTAITPTKAGEGKTTTTIGVGDALNLIGKKAIICLREPSLGPVFGIKGGAAGGGYSQVVPMEDINLHFTGDLHAVTTANNLVSACLDNHIHFGNALEIDINRVVWKRALDMNDRALREIKIGFGKGNGPERNDGFQITVATEIMAILCLAKDLEDFKTKVSRCIVAYTIHNQPVTIGDLGIVGSLAVLMKEAIKPNLVQSLDGSPVFIHGGPFANIAHGCNSLIATRLGLKLADYVVTEAGFGADLGAEKFLDIKCRVGELQPNFVVLVATIKALKMHGGLSQDDLKNSNIEALEKGFSNLEKHVENIQMFHLPYLVAINRFPSDSEEEIQWLKNKCKATNIPVFLSDVYAQGGKGAIDIADYIVHHLQKKSYTPLYDIKSSLEDKIFTIATKMYGARGVVYSEEAKAKLAQYKKMGFDHAYICMAKTPNSLSDNEKLVGRPTNFDITVKEVRLSAGANFVIPLTGAVMTMPGLPKEPSANKIDIDENGKIEGLF